jgi:hypothetical protein
MLAPGVTFGIPGLCAESPGGNRGGTLQRFPEGR